MENRHISEKIRVAHLIHTMAYGGIETALLNWTASMDPERFELHLFCFANPGSTEQPFVDAAVKRGFEVHRIPWSRTKPVWRASRRMAAYVRQFGIDILHCHNTYADLVAVVTKGLTRVRVVTTLYVWGNFGWKRGALQWLDWKLLRYMDQVSAHCEDTFQNTVKRGFPEENLKLLTCGFEDRVVAYSTEERFRLRAQLGASPENVVLLNIARFWPEKAHDVLLTGFRAIREREPRAVLWLLGVGPLYERMQKLSTDLGLQDAVRFLGFREDLPSVLALADIQVHPSDMEGVPLAVCSGMAAGLPIVASSVGGLLEILRDGVSAMLVPPRNPQRFAEAVLEVIPDIPKRERLGAAARRFIQEEYSLAAATARVQDVYSAMMAAR